MSAWQKIGRDYKHIPTGTLVTRDGPDYGHFAVWTVQEGQPHERNFLTLREAKIYVERGGMNAK